MTDQELEVYFYEQLSSLSSQDLMLESVRVILNINVQGELSVSSPLYAAVKRRYDEAGIGVRVNSILLSIQSHFDILVFDFFPYRITIESQQFIERNGSRFYHPVVGNRLTIGSSESTNRNFTMRCIELDNCEIGEVEVYSNVDVLKGFASQFGKLTVQGSMFFRKTVKELDLLGRLGNVKILHCELEKIDIQVLPDQNTTGITSDNPKLLEFDSMKSGVFACQISNGFSLRLYKSEFDAVQIKALTTVNTIELKSCKVPKIDITSPFPPSEISQIIFWDIKDTTDLIIRTLLGNEDFGERSNVKRFTFRDVKISKESTWEIKNYNGVSSLVLIDIFNKGEWIFRNVSFSPAQSGRTSLDDLQNTIESIFVGQNPQELMRNEPGLFLLSCRLGNVSFINSGLPNTFHVYEVDVSGLRFINTGFPISIKPLRYVNFLRNQLEAVQQFRKNADTYGDREMAAYYRGKELSIRLKQIMENPKSIYQNLDEVFSLWLNRISNNHGQNWLLTVVVIFLYGYCSYGVFLSSLGLEVDFGVEGMKLINSQIGYFFDYLVPGFLGINKDKLQVLADAFHLPKEQLQTGFPKACVLFNDIIAMPYLVFQLVSAFRKHVTK